MTLIYQGHQILEWFKGTYFGVWTNSTYQSQQIGHWTKLLFMVFRLIVQLLSNFNGNFQPILTTAVFKQFSTPGKTQLSPNLQLQFSCSFFQLRCKHKFHLWRLLNFLMATKLHVVLWTCLLLDFIRMAQLCRTNLRARNPYQWFFRYWMEYWWLLLLLSSPSSSSLSSSLLFEGAVLFHNAEYFVLKYLNCYCNPEAPTAKKWMVK